MSDTAVIAVVGAGASGLMAAIAAAAEAAEKRIKVKIQLFEKNPRVGKKILVTGNGRCNLTNRNISDKFYFGARDLFNSVYPQFDNNALIDFFLSAGTLTRTDNAGRVYPMSNQAAGILDTLRYLTQYYNIETICETKIESIKTDENGFLLNGKYHAKKCIIACGGCASPVHGSDGSGYELLKMLGITVSDVFPALTALEVKGFTKALKGIRAEGKITVRNAGKELCSALGEIQYTDYGISGIPAMQVSRHISEMLYINKAREVTVFIDSAPSVSDKDLLHLLRSVIAKDKDLPCEILLAGLMPKRLGIYLLSELSLNPSKTVSSIHPAVMEKIVSAVKNKKYTVTSVKGFHDAQVTAGGARAEEFVPDTLEVKRIKGLYVCGELVDIDGDCGGYNLQWAFSSGYVAGVHAVRRL